MTCGGMTRVEGCIGLTGPSPARPLRTMGPGPLDQRLRSVQEVELRVPTMVRRRGTDVHLEEGVTILAG